MMMLWGAFPFTIDTVPYAELSRAREWVWGESPIIGSEPDLQYTGKGLQTIDLTGTLLPDVTGDRSSLEFLARQADLAIPLPLIGGDGKYYGRFVVTNLDHQETNFFVNGVPRKITFTIKMKKYSDKGLSAALSNISSIVSIFA